MKPTKHSPHNKLKEIGQGFVEYALILLFVGLAVVVVVSLMEPAIGDVFSRFVAQAPVAPPSLLNYTPPPTFTASPTVDPDASPTLIPSITLAPSNTPTPTDTSTPTNTPTSTSTNTPVPTVPCAFGPVTLAAGGSARVEMENFRCGGAGVAFFEAASSGGPGSGDYRSDVGAEGPDLENTSDAGGGYNVGWVGDGEWIEYEINAAQAAAYDFTIRNASIDTSDPRIRISVRNGFLQYDSGTIILGSTNGWQDWTNDTVSQVELYQGINTVRITMVRGGGNFNYFDIQPFVPTATPPPGFNLYLEAESGSGLNGRWDIDNNGSASGGQYITWDGSNSTSNPPSSNDHVTYSFNVANAGLYQVHLRVNTNNSSNRDSMWVRIDGANVSQSQNITRSDGWVQFNNMVRTSTWTWDQVHNSESGNALVQFYLPAGSHTLRFGYRESDTWVDRIYITNSGNPP
ncbi:MAG: hypothetical protein CL608_16705 [Anaerolineaceae bacterium]|nr:hypothetical protein [Anaerolineaceae bacterium]